MTLYYGSVTLHVLAALLWLGGMFFLAAVGAPVLRRVEPLLRARLFHEIGLQFRRVGWVAVTVLIVTGVANLHFRGLLRADLLGNPHFWRLPLGRALGVKLTAVVVMIGYPRCTTLPWGRRWRARNRAPPGRPACGASPRGSAGQTHLWDWCW